MTMTSRNLPTWLAPFALVPVVGRVRAGRSKRLAPRPASAKLSTISLPTL